MMPTTVVMEDDFYYSYSAYSYSCSYASTPPGNPSKKSFFQSKKTFRKNQNNFFSQSKNFFPIKKTFSTSLQASLGASGDFVPIKKIFQ